MTKRCIVCRNYFDRKYLERLTAEVYRDKYLLICRGCLDTTMKRKEETETYPTCAE